MIQEEIQKKVIEAVMPCLNSDGMQITDDALCNVIIDCKMKKPFTEAMDRVAQWFNNSGVSEREEEDQNRFVGALINLLTLLAAGDVVALVEHWVLDDME